MATTTKEAGMTTGGLILLIVIVAVLAIMGWSYAQDGDFNPFDNREVASAQFGDTEISITDEGNGSMSMDVDN